jgi:hypothetical protein
MRVERGKVVGGKPVVPRRVATTLFDHVEESFYPVAAAIEIGAEADRVAAIALRRDVGPCALFRGKLSDPIRIIATISKQH